MSVKCLMINLFSVVTARMIEMFSVSDVDVMIIISGSLVRNRLLLE